MKTIPMYAAWGASLVTFAAAVLLVALHTVLHARAAERATISRRARVVAPSAVGTFLAAWLAAAMVAGDDANFPLPPTVRLATLAVVAMGPTLAALALLFSSKVLKSVNAVMPSEWLVRAQTYRVLGVIFIFPFFAYGALPAGFAWPAALGDVAIGAAAPWVAAALAARRPRALALARVWNVLGILDLFSAPTSAVLSHAKIADLYPLVLVPLFIGPPLGILVHVLSLRNLALSARPGTPQRAPTELAVAT